MSTACTKMFSWLPACLEQSAIPTFLFCSSYAHEPCSSGQGWFEEQLGEGAGSGHTRSRRSEREDQRQGSLTLEVQVAAQGCATSRCLERRHCAEPRRWTFAAQRRRSRGSGSVRQRPRLQKSTNQKPKTTKNQKSKTKIKKSKNQKIKKSKNQNQNQNPPLFMLAFSFFLGGRSERRLTTTVSFVHALYRRVLLPADGLS